ATKSVRKERTGLLVFEAPLGPRRPSVSGRQIAAICFPETDSPPSATGPPFLPPALSGGRKGCGRKSKNTKSSPRLSRPVCHFAILPRCRGTGRTGRHPGATITCPAPRRTRSLAQRSRHGTRAACERAEQTPHALFPNARSQHLALFHR